MSRIVLSTMGSLGDLHPMVALALELRRRGHTPVISSWADYADRISALGFEFHPLRPNIDPTDTTLTRAVMDARTGPEMVIRELIFPALGDMYDDLLSACQGADLMLNGEIVYVAGSLAEVTGIPWISTSLAPLSMFSSYDPNVYPTAQFLEYLRPLPVLFHQTLFKVLRWTINDWYGPWKEFRSGLGLDPDSDPIFIDKYSPLLHLALFSRAIGEPQPDWYQPTVQTGFCFYDESENAALDPRLSDFLDSGEPPIVFTLGSAAVMDARDFFDQSAEAARRLGQRALLLYGRDQRLPSGLSDDVVAFDFAPYSQVFGRSSCVVHQGGIGTTAQVLRAGVPQLIMPFSHDQPDNAARCRRAGVAEIIDRDGYSAQTAVAALEHVLSRPGYRANAARLKALVDGENGAVAACDAIESALR